MAGALWGAAAGGSPRVGGLAARARYPGAAGAGGPAIVDGHTAGRQQQRDHQRRHRPWAPSPAARCLILRELSHDGSSRMRRKSARTDVATVASFAIGEPTLLFFTAS